MGPRDEVSGGDNPPYGGNLNFSLEMGFWCSLSLFWTVFLSVPSSEIGYVEFSI